MRKITMQDYLESVRFSTQGLFELIQQGIEEKRAEEEEIIKRQMQPTKNQLDPTNVSPFDDDFFGGDSAMESHRLQQFQHILMLEELRIKQLIQLKQDSIEVLSAAILQIAKQGLSQIYEKPENWPQGREVMSGIYLKDLIYYGRNHSQHYEERKNQDASETDLKNSYTEKMLKKKNIRASEWILCALNPKLEQPMNWKISQANKFLLIIGWSHYDAFAHDMLQLG